MTKTLHSNCWREQPNSTLKDRLQQLSQSERINTFVYVILQMSEPLQRAVLLAFIIIQQNKEYTPFPSATSGVLFFSHVIFAAGLASFATHFPSCGTKIKIKT